MLVSLHVKNLALIEEAELSFDKAFSILTGETGAGKSVLLGSVNMALGEKTGKEFLREGEDYALSELVFRLDNEAQRKALASLDIEPEDEDYVILKRRLGSGRSSAMVNGETVTAAQMKALAMSLIHVHGQRDNAVLLKSDQQRIYLDNFGGEKLLLVKREVEDNYRIFSQLKKEYESLTGEDGSLKREAELARFETDEIEKAAIRVGEYEQLDKQYKKMSSSVKLLECAGRVKAMCGYEEEESAGSLIGSALRDVKLMASLDEEAEGLSSQLMDIEGLLGDFSRELGGYISGLEFDEESYREIEARLSVIGRLMDKYGPSEEEVLAYYDKQCALLEKIGDMDAYKEKTLRAMEEAGRKLQDSCDALTKYRSEAAGQLAKELMGILPELNFLDARVEIRLESIQPSAQGQEEVVFYISMNPGEPLKPLSMVASGGELSRIMLALRTLQASESGAGTLIFDEIDQGISGKTAWKVAERLNALSRRTQVICITHLPQIAAMADAHFLIEKSVENGRTTTHVKELSEEEKIAEIARISSMSEVTQSTLAAAGEMRESALKLKR